MKKEIYEGKFTSTSKKFGFVILENGESDIFIPGAYVNSAMNGDRVRVRIINKTENGKKPEGKIIKILERAYTQLVGTVDRGKNSVFVIPDDSKIKNDIFIPKGKDLRAANNEKVIVKIENYPTADKSAEGVIIKKLGKSGTKDAELMSILEQYSIPYKLTDGVKNEAKNIQQSIKKEDLTGREDFRWQNIITIDGEDTKDVDDAVYVEKINDGYRLYVHIADVTHYVKRNSELDNEAKTRGTSVYLIDTVIPMLPFELSNGICSLNEGEDRLTLTSIMDIDSNGKVISSTVKEGIINVNHHMTYSEIQGIIDGDNNIIDKYKDVYYNILDMIELSRKIDIIREKNGNIDFNTQESIIEFNSKGYPINIKPYSRTEANLIIENFMIYANESVSTEYYWRELPFLYRVHEEPSSEKLEELDKILKSLKVEHHFGEKVYSGQLKKILDSVKNTEIEAFVNKMVLRSMMRARYDTKPLGHFGLGISFYSHFTSPIRRYADLQIHRIIKEDINNNLDILFYENTLEEVAKHISFTQKRADDCEREYDSLQKTKYMSKMINNEYYGNIDHITKFGIYVVLDNTVEGMVRIKDIPFDNYKFIEEKGIVQNADGTHIYKIGDRVKIRVINASTRDRTIDFMFVGEMHE